MAGYQENVLHESQQEKRLKNQERAACLKFILLFQLKVHEVYPLTPRSENDTARQGKAFKLRRLDVLQDPGFLQETWRQKRLPGASPEEGEQGNIGEAAQYHELCKEHGLGAHENSAFSVLNYNSPVIKQGTFSGNT